MPALRHALIAVIVASSTFAYAADSKMAGKWTFEGDVQGYPLHDVCTLTGPDTKLTGTCTMEGKDRAATGTFDGTRLTLAHAGEYQGDALTLTYTGKLQKDGTLSGDVDVQPLNASGSFTATAGSASTAKPQ